MWSEPLRRRLGESKEINNGEEEESEGISVWTEADTEKPKTGTKKGLYIKQVSLGAYFLSRFDGVEGKKNYYTVGYTEPSHAPAPPQ